MLMTWRALTRDLVEIIFARRRRRLAVLVVVAGKKRHGHINSVRRYLRRRTMDQSAPKSDKDDERNQFPS